MRSTRFAAILFLSLVTACVPGAPSGSGPGGASQPGQPGGDGDDDPTGPGSDQGSDDPGQPGGAITATDFLEGMAQGDCQEAFTCMSTFPADAGATFADYFGSSPDQCVQYAEEYYQPDVVEQEIQAGNINFDGDAAAECLDGLQYPTDCNAYWQQGAEYPAACDTAMSGNVEDGGQCTVDFDCANPESICDGASDQCGPDTSQQGSGQLVSSHKNDRTARMVQVLKTMR